MTAHVGKAANNRLWRVHRAFPLRKAPGLSPQGGRPVLSFLWVRRGADSRRSAAWSKPDPADRRSTRRGRPFALRYRRAASSKLTGTFEDTTGYSIRRRQTSNSCPSQPSRTDWKVGPTDSANGLLHEVGGRFTRTAVGSASHPDPPGFPPAVGGAGLESAGRRCRQSGLRGSCRECGRGRCPETRSV